MKLALGTLHLLDQALATTYQALATAWPLRHGTP
jgi:hypothetical protein